MKPHIIILLTLLSHLSGKAVDTEGRIYYSDQNGWKILSSDFPQDPYVAQGFYSHTQLENGWNTLAITTNKDNKDEIQAEGAGRLEAYLTKDQIYDHYRNAVVANGALTDEIKDFFRKQEEFVTTTHTARPDDAHIYNAYLLNIQFDGLRNQYNELQTEDPKKIDPIDFYIINAFGDIFDIRKKFNPPNYDSMTLEELEMNFLIDDHCSALFKVKEDFSDLYLGHNSWYYYAMMTRIFKEYNFNYSHKSIVAKTVLFASYPGCLTSNDDFYITSKDLAVIETTDHVYNDDLFKKIVPTTLLCWQRTMIANRMSTTASEWIDNFVKYNSGTYNNMFMALDMKLVDLDKHIIYPEAMFITDQLPEYTSKNDVTDYLRLGYWPSYNTPFDKEVIKRAKIQDIIDKHPEMADKLDYDMCARATIFRRDQGTITDLASFKKVIRSNNYMNDPLSKGNPTYTVSSRADLQSSTHTPECLGAYDAKVASVKEIKGPVKTIHIISGPTTDNVESFIWSKAEVCKEHTNHGLPDKWEFDWITYTNKFPIE